MNKVIRLVFPGLLFVAVLLLSSCFQVVPEAPPQAEPQTTQPSVPPATPKPEPETPKSTPASPGPAPIQTPTTSPEPVPEIKAPEVSWGMWGYSSWPAEFKATGGAILNLFMKDLITKDGKALITYELKAAGLPKDKVYNLWLKNLSNPVPKQIVSDTRIDDAGYVINAAASHVIIGAYDPVRGEAMDFALMTEDKTTGAIGRIFPLRIESKQGPYRMLVERATPKRDMFIIWGEGFEPGEEIDAVSNSEGEVAKFKIKANSYGKFRLITLPSVVGKQSGLATFTAVAKQGEVKVSYEWGVAAAATPPASPSPTPTPTPTPAPTQSRSLPPLNAFMKGFFFADWAAFDAASTKQPFDASILPTLAPKPTRPPPPGNSGSTMPPPPKRELYVPDEIDPALRNLSATGANWIGLDLTAGQETIASTTIFRSRPQTATDSELQHAIDFAHSLGMRVMLRPQIVLTNDPEHWSGYIGTAFTSEAEWQEWFASYRAFINYYATFGQRTGVDMLCLGIEMGGVTHREQDWRRIIQEVRERFQGPITYSSLSTSSGAQTTFPHGEENRIKWWDAVDYIGVSAYYQLTNKNDPTVAEIKAAWMEKGHLALLENLYKRFNKPILFTEIGYESKDGANQWPGWGGKGRPGPVDLQEQADCYQATLEVMWGKPWLAGIFWFLWLPVNTRGQSGPNDTGYTPYGKPAEEVLKKFYLVGNQ